MREAFPDHFSQQASDYARYRPLYLMALYEYLASLTPAHDRAWDVGTGNGQAAIGLARHFQSIIATDPSAQQIELAVPHERVTYRVTTAERTGLDDRSIDLITVAQAVHWFDLDRFYAEARRVLKPHGVLAVWCYNLTEIIPEVDRVMESYYHAVLGEFWPPQIRWVDQHYRTLPFPFEEVAAPQFTVEAVWSLNDLFGYLNSWSAAQKYKEAHGVDPLDTKQAEFETAWGTWFNRTVRCPLYLRVGKSVTS
ncbi:putative methyltransferase [Thermoflexales bacterium]|nr:putative methyltransferase [Thermoflexales bacterium]